MSKKVTGKAFDLDIFRRLMSFAKNYRLQFLFSVIATILLALVAVVKPILLLNTKSYTDTLWRRGV